MKILFVLLLALGCYANPTGSELKKTPLTVFDFTMVPSNDIKETLQDMIMVEIGKELFLERRKNNLWQCQVDQFGTDYCPTGLAPAKPYTAYYQSTTYERESAAMDYQTGSAVSKTGSVVDYTNKETSTIYTNKTSTTETAPLDAVQIITGSRAGSYAQWNSTSTANRRAYVMWVAGKNGPECWNGWKPWENFSKYDEDMYKNRDNYYHKVDNSRCEYYLGTYNIYGIKYICPPSAQDWDWKVDESAGNCKRVVVVCPQGYTETTGAEVSKGECKKNVTICPAGYTDNGTNCKKTINYALYQYTCPSGYTVANSGLTSCPKTDPNVAADNTSTLDDACNSATPPVGNCSKSISYKYYEYLCQAKNSFLEPIKNLNSGLKSPCAKSDPNNTIDNTGTLDDACNSSTPPVNNCQSTEYTCDSTLFKPVYVGGKWVCSPFMCDGNMKCGYGTCDLPTTPSATKYQDIAYNPLGTVNDNKCNGDICDFVVNARVTYCESKQCPKGDDIIEKNGKCYKLECPAGTYLSGEKCIKVN